MSSPTLSLLGAACRRRRLALPVFLSRVSAGFPSPADDYVEQALDLNDLVIGREEATFFVRAEGESMLGAGISPGDVLVVDRAAEPESGDIVIAALSGELTVKRLRRRCGRLYLEPENSCYEPIEVDTEMHIWGVVTHALKSL